MGRVIDKIRVAHIMGVLHFGGKENGVVNIVNNTDSEIFENYIFAFLRGGSLKKAVNPERCQVVELGRKWGNDYSLPLKVRNASRQYAIDIMHTHAWGTLLEGYLGAKMARTPAFIHGEHGTIKCDGLKHKLVQRFIWNRADCVLSVSRELKDRLVKTIGLPPEKIQIIVNGVDLNKFSNGENGKNFKALLELPPETPVFGSVGRLVEVKNYPLLFRAAKKVFEKMPQSRLLMVGAGPLYGILKQMVSDLGISEQVIFLRWRKNIPDYIRAMDMFILPSFSEGMSNTILEAMACSKPVIATNVGGNPELVVDGQTGLLVPSDDDAAMSAAILDLFGDEMKRRRMAVAGRRRVEAHFTFRQMIRNYERLYIDMAQKHCVLSRSLQRKIERWQAEEEMDTMSSRNLGLTRMQFQAEHAS